MSDPIDLAETLRQLDAFLAPEPAGRAARTRARILRAASELFVAWGYRKTSLDDIAGAAGVAKGTVYLYYAHKAELLLHAIAGQKRQYLAELEPSPERAAGPVERLHEMVRLGVLIGRRLPLLHRLASGDHEIEQALAEVDAETLAGINAIRLDYVARMIEAAAPGRLSAAARRERAVVVIDLLFAIASGGPMAAETADLEAYARAVADVVVGGLLAPSPTSPTSPTPDAPDAPVAPDDLEDTDGTAAAPGPGPDRPVRGSRSG